MEKELEEFVIDFFRAYGCEIEKDKYGWNIKLSEELKSLFDKEQLKISFQPTPEPDREVVYFGCTLMQKIKTFLEAKGKIYMVEAEEKISPVNPQPVFEGFQPRLKKLKSFLPMTVFNFKVSYITDDRYEEIISVTVGPEGEITHEEPEIKTKQSHRAVPSEVIQQMEKAKAEVEKKVLERASGIEKKTLERIKATVHRLHSYYTNLIREMQRAWNTSAEEIMAVQSEFDSKINEILQIAGLKIEVEFLNAKIILIPYARWTYTYANKQIEWAQNLLDGRIVEPLCPVCGKPMKHIRWCQTGNHFFCDNCGGKCEICNSYECFEHGFIVCAECGKGACSLHSTRCSNCGKNLCIEHSLFCSQCGAPLCRECAIKCSKCGNILCNSHARKCRFDFKNYCDKCSYKCSECSEYICVDHIKICEKCGRVFCPEHAPSTWDTGKLLCKTDSWTCKSCHRNFELPNYNICSICGEKVCQQCTVWINEKPYCPECTVICAGCGKNIPVTEAIDGVCQECAIECSFCGKKGSQRTIKECALCGRKFCKEHAGIQTRAGPLCKNCSMITEKEKAHGKILKVFSYQSQTESLLVLVKRKKTEVWTMDRGGQKKLLKEIPNEKAFKIFLDMNLI